MKATLAVLGLALFAVLAECRGQYKQKPVSRGKNLPDKPNIGSADEKEDNGGEDAVSWPKGWMEFAALYAKCESAAIMIEEFGNETAKILETVGLKLEDSVLNDACPRILFAGAVIMAADKEARKAAVPYLELGFPVIQCANLIAETESLVLLTLLSGKNPEENNFLKEAKVLFDVCYELFKGMDGLEEKLKEEEKEAVDAVKEANAAKRSMRQLLAHFRK
ncbi:uncharacterized protein LOC127859071 [Dreissena polymorpha]|uniref:uncharacterized protein LOC127859071 n=1 Tax=Dreissena polymorpha TaxID=45954 RepID=UPI002264E7D0|nr:uncharacterized protein LOC127859071 [Dreissena polymorpha]XP_052252441.1 uncharacterized protein LOC127859071 [Dreissena polymorpha]